MGALALAAGLPVILVVGLRLGCLNHALLTTDAIRSSGCTLAGWVGNVLDPQMAELEANVATLHELIPVPCLGVVPRLPHPAPLRVAELLDLPPTAAAR
jgi:dethiobiotin synthetase